MYLLSLRLCIRKCLGKTSTILIWCISDILDVTVTGHSLWQQHLLTHWGRVTHICVSNLIIIGSDNGLSPCRRQAIIWTNAGILFIGPLGTTFSEILNEMLTFWFMKMRLKVSSAKWRPFCLGLNVLINYWNYPHHIDNHIVQSVTYPSMRVKIMGFCMIRAFHSVLIYPIYCVI